MYDIQKPMHLLTSLLAQATEVATSTESSSGREFFLFLLVVTAIFVILRVMSHDHKVELARVKQESFDAGLIEAVKNIETYAGRQKETCECGRKATHFVNVNGVDQPVCALHAQEILANV